MFMRASAQVAVAGLGRDDGRQQARHLGRRVELAALLAGIGGEVADQILVDVADDVPLPDLRGPQVEPFVVEVLEQVYQAGVALPRFAQVGLAVEIDVAEDAFELGAVGVFDPRQRLVDALADVRLLALRVQVVEVALLGENKALTRHGAGDAVQVAAVAGSVLLHLLPAQVGEVLQE
jgi:hypothetical protein